MNRGNKQMKVCCRISMNKAAKALPLFLLITLLALFPIVYYQAAALNVTVFNASFDQLNLRFPLTYMTNRFYIQIPNGTVSEARMRLESFDIQGQSIEPADVILVTDTSTSMTTPITGGTKMDAAKRADISFVNATNTDYIHIGLVHYSDNSSTRLDRNLTDNKTALNNTINNYGANGFTAMGRGMRLAINELLNPAHTQPGARKIIVLMTDGWANCNETGSSNQICNNARNVTAREYVRSMANLAAANNIVIYGIAFGNCSDIYTSTQNSSDCKLINNISNITGGKGYNTSSATGLMNIYNEIANIIDATNFTTPVINSTLPAPNPGWRSSSEFRTEEGVDIFWDGASCGYANAICRDFRTVIQNNSNHCTAFPCNISFSVFSPTVGILNFSELYIEINDPPAPTNIPPSGSCPSREMNCTNPQLRVSLDDGSLVTDPNDNLETLSWKLDHIINQSNDQAHIILDSDFNTSRELIFVVDSTYRTETFWQAFYFNITDPWGATTTACINVSYIGCTGGASYMDISDRTLTFDISAYPGGRAYNLSDMIDAMPGFCSEGELGYIISGSDNFQIIGPSNTGEIIAIPKSPDTGNPDWYTPASEQLDVTIYCANKSTGATANITTTGNGDIILVTDFSGSMKKDVDTWREGTGIGSRVEDCLNTYEEDNARKTHVARCLDSELAEIVLENQGNRLWPLFIRRDDILSYSGNPQDLSRIIDYIFSESQGMDQTCLSCAINEGYDILAQSRDDERTRFIVLMTDGVPTHCAQGSCVSTSTAFGNSVCAGFCDTQGQNYCDEDNYYYAGIGGCLLDDTGCSLAENNTIFSAGRSVQDLNVIFYTISFGLIENCPRSEYLLRPIAALNDGVYNHSSNVDQLRQIYREIAYRILEASRVSTQYNITGAINDTAVLTINYVSPSNGQCNNSIVESGEECDDGNRDNTDACSSICTLTFCNDRTIQQPNGRNSLMEECDDGNFVDDDDCSNQCIIQYCGDQITQIGRGEQCDNGDGYFNDICLENCTWAHPEEEHYCGDNSSDYDEECDDGCQRGNPALCDLADNGDGCNQFCQLEEGPVLSLNNETISFNYSYFYLGGYDYWLDRMVSRRYATLPCPDESLQFTISPSINFSITEPINPFGNITIVPDNPDWSESTSQEQRVRVSCWDAGEEHTSEANLMILYDGEGAPDGDINCKSPTPRYLLHRGREVEIKLTDIFDFIPPYGNVYEIREQSTDNILITSELDGTPEGSNITAQSVGFVPVFETARIRVFTDNGINSFYCPVTFFDMNSNCDKDECTACINNRDLNCFANFDCLAPTPIFVLNPFTPVRASRYVPRLAPASYSVDFEPLPGSGFRISSLSGSGSNEIFNVSGAEASHGTMNASVMHYSFDGYTGSARVCPLLRRLNYTIGEESLDPVTDLLITSSRAITGFYDWGGIRSKGPYIFTAKVWLR